MFRNLVFSFTTKFRVDYGGDHEVNNCWIKGKLAEQLTYNRLAI